MPTSRKLFDNGYKYETTFSNNLLKSSKINSPNSVCYNYTSTSENTNSSVDGPRPATIGCSKLDMSSPVVSDSGIPKSPNLDSTIHSFSPYVTAAGQCIEWTRDINGLLNDPTGVKLLRLYLETTDDKFLTPSGTLALDLTQRIDYYFACKGYEEQFQFYSFDQKISLARTIYKKWIKRDAAIKNQIKNASKLKTISCKIFSQSNNENCEFLHNNVLQRFLSSSVFKNYWHENDKKVRKRGKTIVTELPRIIENELPDPTNDPNHPYFIAPENRVLVNKQRAILPSVNNSEIE